MRVECWRCTKKIEDMRSMPKMRVENRRCAQKIEDARRKMKMRAEPYVFSQGCVGGWPGTAVPRHLLPLRWPVFHVDMMVVVSRKLCICCCVHFCWLCTEKAVVFQELSLRWVSLVLQIYYGKSDRMSVFGIRFNWNVFNFHTQEILCTGLIPLCIID